MRPKYCSLISIISLLYLKEISIALGKKVEFTIKISIIEDDVATETVNPVSSESDKKTDFNPKDGISDEDNSDFITKKTDFSFHRDATFVTDNEDFSKTTDFKIIRDAGFGGFNNIRTDFSILPEEEEKFKLGNDDFEERITKTDFGFLQRAGSGVDNDLFYKTTDFSILREAGFYGDNVDLLISSFSTDFSILEDAKLDTCNLIRKYEYPCEVHIVHSEDMYILTMHRIPYGQSGRSNGARPVVFLQHGLLGSSGDWVLMTPGKGLAYILADAGYDVWMGNARGNRYSRNHATLKPTSSSFWKFSWHEIGYYDLPAMIDYVIKNTKVSKIQYVGYSQGTTSFWVMTSMRPEFNDKIIAMQALAPVAFLGEMKSPFIEAIAPFTKSLKKIIFFRVLGLNEVLSSGTLLQMAGQHSCNMKDTMQDICTNLLFLICGYDEQQFNKTMLPVIMDHTPAGSSTRQLVHYGQLYNSKEFVEFDHGVWKNIEVYGKFKPPKYNLANIRTPIYLHYADNDWFGTPEGVHRLSQEIKSVKGVYKVPHEKYNHLDFVYAINASSLVYDKVLSIMNNINSNF